MLPFEKGLLTKVFDGSFQLSEERKISCNILKIGA